MTEREDIKCQHIKNCSDYPNRCRTCENNEKKLSSYHEERMENKPHWKEPSENEAEIHKDIRLKSILCFILGLIFLGSCVPPLVLAYGEFEVFNALIPSLGGSATLPLSFYWLLVLGLCLLAGGVWLLAYALGNLG